MLFNFTLRGSILLFNYLFHWRWIINHLTLYTISIVKRKLIADFGIVDDIDDVVWGNSSDNNWFIDIT